jgi:hypothetical protein
MRTSILRATGLACAAVATFAAVGTVTPVAMAHASGNPLAGLTADQIASKAIANLKAASSVRLTGSGKSSGQAFTVSISLTPKGCDGTIGIPKKGTFVLLAIGEKAWIQPSNQFWESEGIPSSELSLVSGKYIPFSGATAKALSGLDAFCTPKDFADDFAGPVIGLIKGATTTVGGQSAVEIKDAADSAFMDISLAAKPELLRLDAPGKANFLFSHYDAPVTLTAPSPSDVISMPGS